MAAIAKTPPTTPPAIAPTGVLEERLEPPGSDPDPSEPGVLDVLVVLLDVVVLLVSPPPPPGAPVGAGVEVVDVVVTGSSSCLYEDGSVSRIANIL